MSAQYPHNVRIMSAQHLLRETYVLREMLCRHSADIYLQGYMSAQCPHYIRLRFSALNNEQFFLNDSEVQQENEGQI